MRVSDNCRIFRVADCPFLQFPYFHSGYTGKSGPETWYHCKRLKKAIRNIKTCELAGDYEAQKKKFIEK